MPTLNWIGKEAVIKHHKAVPFRLAEPVAERSCGENHGADSGNLIVQGDNLLALKALLPRYAGQVKCIYIDPPYNTGKEVEGLGGGFQYCRLSDEPLFKADGPIRADVTFAQLAEFVWFMETGTGLAQSVLPKRNKHTPFLGMYKDRAVFLLYDGLLKDKSDIGGNVLNNRTLDILAEALPDFEGERVVYGARSRFDKRKLAALGITFHQLPYELAVKTWF
ncbi:MAG: hypothetical protein H6999_07250 [Hahellaceae bacterium]|nr:hypothetical protein [Hahellaceae bacterium]